MFLFCRGRLPPPIPHPHSDYSCWGKKKVYKTPHKVVAHCLLVLVVSASSSPTAAAAVVLVLKLANSDVGASHWCWLWCDQLTALFKKPFRDMQHIFFFNTYSISAHMDVECNIDLFTRAINASWKLPFASWRLSFGLTLKRSFIENANHNVCWKVLFFAIL